MAIEVPSEPPNPAKLTCRRQLIHGKSRLPSTRQHNDLFCVYIHDSQRFQRMSSPEQRLLPFREVAKMSHQFTKTKTRSLYPFATPVTRIASSPVFRKTKSSIKPTHCHYCQVRITKRSFLARGCSTVDCGKLFCLACLQEAHSGSAHTEKKLPWTCPLCVEPLQHFYGYTYKGVYVETACEQAAQENEHTDDVALLANARDIDWVEEWHERLPALPREWLEKQRCELEENAWMLCVHDSMRILQFEDLLKCSYECQRFEEVWKRRVSLR